MIVVRVCDAAVLSLSLTSLVATGLGVAALWPLDKARYFLDWRPIRVSPLNLRVFFGRQGLEVLISEWRWVWLPCVTAGATVWLLRRALTNVRRKLRYWGVCPSGRAGIQVLALRRSVLPE